MVLLYWIIGLLLTVYVSIWTIKKNREIGFTILTVLLSGYILISNILTPRLSLFNLGFTQLTVVTGSLIWPFTAQLSDMINEVYGKRKTFIAVALGYSLNLLFVLFVFMANSTQPIWDTSMEEFWQSYFLPSGRVFLASTVSFIVCQLIDINVFSFLKEKFRNREETSRNSALISFSSLRSVLSDVINMVCDAVLFTLLAFALVLPLDSLIDLVIGSIIFKGLLSIIDTPLFALFRVSIKNIQRQE